MTLDVRSNQPMPRPAAKPTGAAAAPQAAETPATRRPASAGPSAGADAAIAQGLGTGNLQPLDALLDRAVSAASSAAKAAPSLASRALGAIQSGRVTRFFRGVRDFFTPDPAHVKRALDAVRNHVWERPINWLARQLGVDDMAPSIRVVADPPDVNRPDAALDAQARRALSDPTLQAQTAKALAKLAPADRQRFAQLAAKLKQQPRALAALQGLAREGRLAAKDLAGGQTLLTHLHALGTQLLDPRVQKAGQTELLSHVLLEIAEPGAIAQKGVNTCGATVVQHILARDNPGEYVRLVAGLASPAGAVKLQDGRTIRRDAEWDAEIDVSKRFGGVRSISSRLIQPAFMHLACTFEYSNRRDGSLIPLLDMSIMGIVPWGMSKLLGSVTGRSFDWDVATRTSTFEARMREASPQNPVPIALNYAERRGEIGPHWVQVVGFDAATERIIALNPWGRKETIPLDVATSHLLAVVHPE